IVYLNRSLIKLLGQLLRRLIRLVRCGEAADYFYELHHRHGIKEMHADYFVWTVRECSDFCDRNRRSVARQNDLRTANAVDVTEDLRLHIEFLSRGFDY